MSQAGNLFRCGSFGTRDIIGWDNVGGKANGSGWIILYNLSIDSDVMTDGKADMVPVEHRHSLFFIGLPAPLHCWTRLKNGRAIGSFNREFWLEDPCFVAAFLWLALLVDQKECHRPGMVSAAH